MSDSTRSNGERKRRSGGPSSERRRRGSRRRRFTYEERLEALKLVASGVARSEIAKAIGCSCESVRLWVRSAEQGGSMPAPPAASDVTAEASAKAPDAGGVWRGHGIDLHRSRSGPGARDARGGCDLGH